MAAQFLNRLGQVGLGVAVIGGVVNSALYNGENNEEEKTLSVLFCVVEQLLQYSNCAGVGVPC